MKDNQLQILILIGISVWVVFTCIYILGYDRFESDLVGSLFNSSLVIMGLVLGFLIKSIKRKTKEAIGQS